MKNKIKAKLLLSVTLALILALSIVAVSVFADNGEERVDAMEAIESSFSSYRIGETQSVADDGYIGIPLKITTYYDYATHGASKPGYNGTPVIGYVVNANVERIGAKTDVEIISSMLERGYIVSVIDYLGQTKAKSPDLDWSTQTVRQNIKKGSYFTDKNILKSGTYYDMIVIPAGYDVSLSNIFWEADKHGADGTLEKIVENWNTDLRGWFRDTVIYWKDIDGVKKATQKGIDGSDPVWYSDAKGTVAVDASAENASYIKVQHTLALDITDCVGKDGTPIDLNLYMHVVYPTTTKENPIDAVPVIALANSSEYLSNGLNTADRPQFSGFLFNGYAGVVFDYLYQPMAQSDYFGYYDGRTALGALTGDRMNYGLHLYSDKKINTAAMRYVRYLTLTDPSTYVFDTDKIGVYGNSKGGWFTFLGEAELREYTVADESAYTKEALEALIDARINNYTSKRVFDGHDDETRYQNGIVDDYTKHGVTIDGGELQPWLTYEDKDGKVHEILGYASWIYASNGGNDEDITEGHAPVFSALHLRDDFSTVANSFGEITGKLDIPSFYVFVDLGHTFAYGPELYHGYDTYVAMFDFANYYLRGDAVKVVYTDPASEKGELDVTSPITIKFSGTVTKDEIAKVTLVSASRKAVAGSWSSIRGGTEWTFTHDAMIPGEKYTLTVPAGFAGNNGSMTAEAYTAEFYTVSESVTSAESITTANGTYITVPAPELAGSEYAVRFHVANDAANIAKLYAVSDFNVSSPDSSTVGALLGEVNLKGEGYYEINVTDYVGSAEADEYVFLLKAAKSAGVTETYKATFESSLGEISLGAYVRGSTGTAPDGTAAAKVYVTTNVKTSGTQQYAHEVFYQNTTTAFSNNKLFGTSAIKASDLGRRYRVTMRVYDTEARVVQIMLNGAYVLGGGVHDFDRVFYNLTTKAGEWVDLSFDYVVYEPEYGNEGLQRKTLTVKLATTGENEAPIYIESLKVEETVTGITLASDAAALVATAGPSYKAPEAEAPFTVGTSSYSTFAAALGAAKDGATVTLHKNYTLTSSDNFSDFGKFGSVTLDLNGYKLYCESTNPLIHAKATSLTVAKTVINIKNGSIYLKNAPLVGYSGSNASGNGKQFAINLKSVYLTNMEGSVLANVLTSPTIESSSGASVAIGIEDSVIEVNKARNSNNYITLLSNGSSSLNVSYVIKGGSIKCDTLVRVKLWDAFKKTEFYADAEGNYTTLVIPSSENTPEYAVMLEDGIASYTASSVTNGMVTYTASKSDLSTRYGLIPEKYADADAYPFVFFDENGNFKGAYGSFIGNGDNGAGGVLGAAKDYVQNAWDGSSYGENPKEAFVVMRRDYTFSSSKDVKLANLAQLSGTINIDLCGFTLSAGNVAYPIFPAFSKGFSGALGNKIFPSTIVVNNGTLRNYKSGIVAMSTWDSVGGGTIADKDFNFIFNNVTLGFVENADAAGLIAHGWAKTGTPGAAAPFNFTYNDCTFDVKSQTNPTSPTIFSLATVVDKYIKLSINVNGGKIVAKDPAKVTVVGTSTSDIYGSSITFAKGKDGEYTKYYAPTGTTVATGAYTVENGDIYGFAKIGTEGTDDVYTLDTNPLVTKYGVITDAYKSADDYPFVVFDADTKAFVKGYATLKQAFDGAKVRQGNNAWDKTTGKFTGTPVSSVILQRRDYTTVSADYYDNWGQVKGTITFDLGGNKLEQGSDANGLLWFITIKGWGGKVYPTVFNIKNGYMNVRTSAVVQANVWATVDMNYRPFTMNFDNVSFGFAEGATTSNLLIQYSDQNTASGYSSTVATNLYLNYNNCTFDLATNASTSGAKLFNAAGGENVWIKATVTVCGGEIKAPKLSLSELYSTETKYGSSVKFVKDADGNYTKLYIANGGAAPSGNVATDSGNMRFVKTETGSATTLYTLTSLTTPYGAIPESKASIEDYPFVVFDTDGNYYGAFANLLGNQGGAMGNAIYTVLRDYNKWDEASGKYVPDEGSAGVRTAVIYLRRDYTMTAGEYHNNLSHTQGTIIIDLGGHTVYSDSSRTKPVFDSTGKGWDGTDDGNKVFPSSFIVKNGEFRNHSSAVLQLVCNDSIGGNAIAKKPVSWTFENVTFGLIKGATVTTPVIFIKDAVTTTGTLPASITFNDCTFDFESVAPTVQTTVINAAFGTKSYTKGTVTVNGGKLLASSLANIKIFALDAKYGSSVTFGKGSEGEYFGVIISSTAAYPDTTAFSTADGEATLTISATSGGKSTYVLKKSIVTEYGNIPARYESAEDYPFVVFLNGKFVFATAIFGKDASDSALHKSKANGSVILLRRDFVYNESQYNNLSQGSGLATLDLGGYTIYCKQSGTNAFFFAQKKTNSDSSWIIKNGTILTAKNPIIKFSSWGGSSTPYSGGHYFNFTFENVTLGACEGTEPKVLIATQQIGLSEPLEYGRVILNNCTVDLSGVENTVLFDLSDNSGVLITYIEISGGKIICDGMENITVGKIDTSRGNSLTFGKGTDGSYTVITLPVGKEVTKEVFTDNNGKSVAFARFDVTDGIASYTLAPVGLSDFKVSTNLTLSSDFVLNIYVEARAGVTSVFVDGIEYTLSELEKIELDGKECYVIRKNIASSEAAEDVVLKVTLASDEEYTGTWTINILKYAEKILGGDYSEVTRALIKDILKYIADAYVYFAKANAQEVVAKIEAIIGEYTARALPEMEIATEHKGLSAASMILDATPGFVFYPELDESGNFKYAPELYEFRSGSGLLETVVFQDADGKTCIKVLSYAYGMCENVTYTVSGTDICGEYNIATYYEYAKSTGNSELISVVESLWRYSIGAAEYRAEING